MFHSYTSATIIKTLKYSYWLVFRAYSPASSLMFILECMLDIIGFLTNTSKINNIDIIISPLLVPMIQWQITTTLFTLFTKLLLPFKTEAIKITHQFQGHPIPWSTNKPKTAIIMLNIKTLQVQSWGSNLVFQWQDGKKVMHL